MTMCSWKFADRITGVEWSLERQGEPFAQRCSSGHPCRVGAGAILGAEG
jgi:hypothetical protein